jgi:hypothetical protein
MVLSSTQSENDKPTSNKSLFIGYLIFCVIIGLVVGFSLSNWEVGVIAGVTLLIMGICLLALSVFFGLICIPPMILIDKLTGNQKVYTKESDKADE